MRILVTGSSGHLGEALMRTLRAQGREAIGLDIVGSSCTDRVGSIADAGVVAEAMRGVDAVLHTATLHKPHIATHSRRDFVDTNVTGTLNLLEAAVAQGVRAFVFTSTTSAFGDALRPAPDAPAVWIDEDVIDLPKNIYGATKRAAEDLCRLTHRNQGLNCLVLRTARFFPEPDDDESRRGAFPGENLRINELLHRRADVQDLVDAHLLAIERAPVLGYGRYILSATTPFGREDALALRHDASAIVARHVPEYVAEYARRGWRMYDRIDRVYDNSRARAALGWEPRFDFAQALRCLREDRDPCSALSRRIGIKGYHGAQYADGLYPVDRVPVSR